MFKNPSFIPAFFAILLATACAPGPASRYPSSAVSQTTTLIAATVIRNTNPHDPENPQIDLNTPQCSATICDDYGAILEPYRTKLIG